MSNPYELVCDRCGKPTCGHMFDSDYATQTRREYEYEWNVIFVFVSLLAIIIFIILRHLIYAR